MKYFVQFAVIGFMCVLGEIISAVLPFPFPSSVIGMILLFILLMLKTVKPCHIRETAEFLQKNMALFFVPIVTSVMQQWDILKTVFVRLAVICVITTVITFIVTAYAVKLTIWLQQRVRRKSDV